MNATLRESRSSLEMTSVAPIALACARAASELRPVAAQWQIPTLSGPSRQEGRTAAHAPKETLRWIAGSQDDFDTEFLLYPGSPLGIGAGKHGDPFLIAIPGSP